MRIAILIALFVLAVISAADETEDEDLGIVDSNQGLFLEDHSGRKDFVCFLARFYPQNPPTNVITVIVTNLLIKPSVLGALQAGTVRVGLTSLFDNGQSSAPKFYRFTLLREDPPFPSAVKVWVLPFPDLPPMPPDVTNSSILHRSSIRSASVAPPVLPGTNETYEAHMSNAVLRAEKTGKPNMEAMLYFFQKHKDKRRNQ